MGEILFLETVGKSLWAERFPNAVLCLLIGRKCRLRFQRTFVLRFGPLDQEIPTSSVGIFSVFSVAVAKGFGRFPPDFR